MSFLLRNQYISRASQSDKTMNFLEQTEMPGVKSPCELQNDIRGVCVWTKTDLSAQGLAYKPSRVPGGDRPSGEIHISPTPVLGCWNRRQQLRRQSWTLVCGHCGAGSDRNCSTRHQIHSIDLLCLFFLNMKEFRSETSDGLIWKISYFRVTFTAKNVLKVILLFTHLYFIKDNPPMSERRQELRVSIAGALYLEVLFCVRKLKRQDRFVFCLKAI